LYTFDAFHAFGVGKQEIVVLVAFLEGFQIEIKELGPFVVINNIILR
jgi:hypothetical protein